uniref:Uncharacterized protein n=1 Tax=Anguilla anguilla TaxID=7936 RepID=A0A0E9P522_ANGAN
MNSKWSGKSFYRKLISRIILLLLVFPHFSCPALCC